MKESTLQKILTAQILRDFWQWNFLERTETKIDKNMRY